MFWLNTDLHRANGFTAEVEAVRGQALIARAFPAGISTPADVVVTDAERAGTVRTALEDASGVLSLGPVERGEPGARFELTLRGDPYSQEAFRRISDLRERARKAGGPEVLIGGPTAEEADVRAAATRDNAQVMRLVLLAVFAILAVLLRALVAPLMLVATVVLSFAAVLGAGAFLFEYAFRFPGMDATVPIFAFVFLVALGVDYNIFLMARVREEATRHGTREGMIRGLAVTGSVITSAGLVLAGTFGALVVLPSVLLIQVGFVIALGVLIDTFLVRTFLVPALTHELGARLWWPSALAREPGRPAAGDLATVRRSLAGPSGQRTTDEPY